MNAAIGILTAVGVFIVLTFVLTVLGTMGSGELLLAVAIALLAGFWANYRRSHRHGRA